MNYNLASLLALFKSFLNPVTQGNNRLILYAEALKCLGKDASPNDVVPDEVGCAESVSDIIIDAFGIHAGIAFSVSTYLLYQELSASKGFTRVDVPLEGDIIISPTGFGNGTLPNGHVGIVGQINNTILDSSLIMSNTSATGLFTQNYTIGTWKARYQQIGGYPVVFFRKI